MFKAAFVLYSSPDTALIQTKEQGQIFKAYNQYNQRLQHHKHSILHPSK